MMTAFVVFRPFAPELEVHLNCKKGAYHLKILRCDAETLTLLHDDDHPEPNTVVDVISALIYSRSHPNIGTISRLVYGLRSQPEFALLEFQGDHLHPGETRPGSLLAHHGLIRSKV